MPDDRLSEVFDLVEVTTTLTGGVTARGGWWSRTLLDDPVKFFAMVSGRARLTTDGLDAPIELEPGDVAILIGRSWVAFEAGDTPRLEALPESDFSAERFAIADRVADDVLVGGCVDLTPAGRALLLGALPPVAHVRAAAAESGRLHATLMRLFDEVTGDRIGSVFAIRQYARLLLLEVLRAYAGQADAPPGLLRLLTDQRLRPALALMHAEPGRAWGLEELARAAAMSRTSFAVRFREVAGVPPLSYLNTWRMLLAQRALRAGDVRVGELAAQLGYGSESAFSTAFKRVVGESPMRYRQRVRGAVTVV
ncbi:AraC family transcriptional regulator [Nocardia sp. bgisy134]|uniref:helix-turn-helix transcriptional regulator n=1 Tax=Nocardia sp. bgisy134 TaxID=3413789 RepID=UPI003D75E12F